MIQRVRGRNPLFLCGVVAPLVLVVGVEVGGRAWQESALGLYSQIEQAVSELVARDAPNRLAMTLVLIAYNLLLLAFAWTLREFARARPGGGLGVAGANRLVALALTGLFILMTPVDPRGGPMTWMGGVHTLLAALMAGLATLGMALCGWWMRGEPDLRREGVYALASAAVMALLGVGALATLGTGVFGLWERLLMGAYEQWMFVMGLRLYQMGTAAAPVTGLSEA